MRAVIKVCPECYGSGKVFDKKTKQTHSCTNCTGWGTVTSFELESKNK